MILKVAIAGACGRTPGVLRAYCGNVCRKRSVPFAMLSNLAIAFLGKCDAHRNCDVRSPWQVHRYEVIWFTCLVAITILGIRGRTRKREVSYLFARNRDCEMASQTPSLLD